MFTILVPVKDVRHLMLKGKPTPVRVNGSSTDLHFENGYLVYDDAQRGTRRCRIAVAVRTPDGDGLDCIEFVCASDGMESMPVLLVTALGTIEIDPSLCRVTREHLREECRRSVATL